MRCLWDIQTDYLSAKMVAWILPSHLPLAKSPEWNNNCDRTVGRAQRTVLSQVGAAIKGRKVEGFAQQPHYSWDCERANAPTRDTWCRLLHLLRTHSCPTGEKPVLLLWCPDLLSWKEHFQFIFTGKEW